MLDSGYLFLPMKRLMPSCHHAAISQRLYYLQGLDMSAMFRDITLNLRHKGYFLTDDPRDMIILHRYSVMPPLISLCLWIHYGY